MNSPAKPNISVPIPNWNGECILPRCLASLRRASETAGLGSVVDTIIADDQSTDRSLVIVRHDFPEVRLIEMGLCFSGVRGEACTPGCLGDRGRTRMRFRGSGQVCRQGGGLRCVTGW